MADIISTATPKTNPVWVWFQDVKGGAYYRCVASIIDSMNLNSTVNETDATSLDQQIAESSIVESVDHTLTFQAGIFDPLLFAETMYGAVYKNGAIFIGSVEVEAKRFKVWLIDTGADAEDNYGVSFFRYCSFDKTTSLNFSKGTNTEFPVTFNILSDVEVATTEDVGTMKFKSTSNVPQAIVIPTFDGGSTVNLEVQTIYPKNEDTAVSLTVKPQVILNKKTSNPGDLKLTTVADPNTEIPSKPVLMNSVTGIAKVGSTNTTIIHDGDAYPVDAFVGTTITINFEETLVDIRTITAYNAETKTFTISTGSVTQAPENKEYNIQAGYSSLELTNSLTANTKYQLILSNSTDLGNQTIPIQVVRFETSATRSVKTS